jgi:threonine dehydratase
MTMTPLVKLDEIYLKREDLNITGSAKDRALIKQIQKIKKEGLKSAVISSTGNAAISALYFCLQNKIKLTIFVSPKINPTKLKLIKNKSSEIIQSDQPISDAFKFSKKNGAYFLRQSTDPQALLGYQSIGQEILEQLPNVTSIFIPVGSGTTLLGISQSLPKTIKIFAVQPANYCSITQMFDTNFETETKSITDALGVKFLPLKSKIIDSINNSNGSGLVIQNSEIQEASKYLTKNNIITSNEGALALAGFYKATRNKFNIGKYPVFLLTGTKR